MTTATRAATPTAATTLVRTPRSPHQARRGAVSAVDPVVVRSFTLFLFRLVELRLPQIHSDPMSHRRSAEEGRQYETERKACLRAFPKMGSTTFRKRKRLVHDFRGLPISRMSTRRRAHARHVSSEGVGATVTALPGSGEGGHREVLERPPFRGRAERARRGGKGGPFST